MIFKYFLCSLSTFKHKNITSGVLEGHFWDLEPPGMTFQNTSPGHNRLGKANAINDHDSKGHIAASQS